MPASFSTIRTGHKYFLRNYSDEYYFEVLDILSNGDCKLKDIDTLELYNLKDLIRYGKGGDFEFYEIKGHERNN